MKKGMTAGVERGFLEGKVESNLRQQLKLSRFAQRWRKIKKDIKFFETGMLDVLIIDKTVRTVEMLEHSVNSYIELEYRSEKIEKDIPEYRIGSAKQVFVRLYVDREENREREILFVGS